MLGEPLDRLETLIGDRLHRHEALAQPVLRDPEDQALRLVQDVVRVLARLVRRRDDPAAGLDQAAQDRLLLDDAGVVLDVGGARNPVEEGGDVRRAADRVELAGARQLLLDRHRIDGARPVRQMVHDLEDLAVLVAVEILFLENLLGAIDGAVLDEDGPENGALGLDAVRHVLVERDIAGHVVCLRKRGAAIVTLCCAAFRGFVKITPGRSETDGRCPDFRSGERKVRTPQGIALGNTQSRRREGKCHRKQTAGAGSSASVPVRVKRWGKSPPVPRVTGAARQTPQGARPNRGAFAGGPPVSSRVGRLAPGPGTMSAAPSGARSRAPAGSGTPPPRVTAGVEE